MLRGCLIIYLISSLTHGQERYWGSYSASYPAGGGGDSTNVAFAIANEQEVSRQFLAASCTSSEIAAPSPKVSIAQGLKSKRPSGYLHDSTGDTGLPYIHDPSGDFGPYKLFKWRQHQKLEAEKEVAVTPALTHTPRKKVLIIRKQKVKTAPLQPIRPAFESFPSRQEQKQTPRVQNVRQQQKVKPARLQEPLFKKPAPVVPVISETQHFTAKRVPQTPQFISQATGLSPESSFAQRSYSYTAPTYAAQAQGVSFTYEALL